MKKMFVSFLLLSVIFSGGYLWATITDNDDDLIVPAGESYTPSYSTKTFNNSVQIYGTLYVQDYSGGSGSGRLFLTASTITINGEIDALGRGYNASSGPGKPPDGVPSGGGYGGKGGRTYQPTDPSGEPYGSIKEPFDLGSGGNDGYYYSDGGGAIRLKANDEIVINGKIIADGHSGFQGGGGSGGSIYIETDVISGTGTIQAAGGNAEPRPYGAGAGGRIAVYFNDNQFAGTITAHGGTPYGSGTFGQCGGAGTIFLKPSSLEYGSLIIDNYPYSGNITPIEGTFHDVSNINSSYIQVRAGKVLNVSSFTYIHENRAEIYGTLDTEELILENGVEPSTITNHGTLSWETSDFRSGKIINHGTVSIQSFSINNISFVNEKEGTLNINSITVGTGGTLELTKPISVANINISSGGVITHKQNSFLKEFSLDMTVSGDLNVESYGSINVKGKGYSAGILGSLDGKGFGGGSSNLSPCGGGSYGGYGGGEGGIGGIYGSITSPAELGSGGASIDYNGNLTPGGSGGGLCRLVVNGKLTVSGSINAEGNAGQVLTIGPNNFYTGGGSGGSIYISADEIAGSGLISACGGINGGYSGGGGRVALYYNENSFSGLISAYGGLQQGNPSGAGSAGTIFTKGPGNVYGNLTMDNDTNQSPIYSTIQDGTYVFDTIELKNYAKFSVSLGNNVYAEYINLGSNATFKNSGNTYAQSIDIGNSSTLLNNSNLNVWDLAIGNNVNFTNSGTINFESLIFDTVQSSVTNNGILSSEKIEITGGKVVNNGTITSGNNSITIGDSAILEQNAPLSITNLYVNSGGLLTHTPNQTTSQYLMDITVTGEMHVSNGGLVNTDGRGYIANYGPGKGTNGGGGGYGGKGGKSSGGNVYGSTTTPVDIGSGGDYSSGGNGGGAIKINAGKLTIDGNISSNGTDSTNSWSGGGSGGSIYIISNIINGTGLISACGGNGGDGAGGGGRIAIYYDEKTNFLCEVVATGGTGYYNGENGTIYMKDSNLPEGVNVSEYLLSDSETTLIDRMGTLLWESELQASATGQVTVSTEAVNSSELEPGKFSVTGKLSSNMSQKLAEDIDSFYVTRSSVILSVETDKNIYQPNDNIQITCVVRNDLPDSTTSLALVIMNEQSQLYYEEFELSPGSSHTVIISTTALRSFWLSTSIDGMVVNDRVVVEESLVEAEIDAVETASQNPFDVSVTMKNVGKRDVVLGLKIEGTGLTEELNVSTITLAIGETKTFKKTFEIVKNTTFTVTLSRDLSAAYEEFVEFGEKVGVVVAPSPVYPPGIINIPYTLENTGKFDSEFALDFKIDGTTGTKEITISTGSIISDSWVITLSSGQYVFEYSSIFGSGTADIQITEDNIVEISTINILGISAGKLLITATLRNLSSNKFVGSLALDTGFYSGEQDVFLETLETKGIAFNVDVPASVTPGQYSAKTTLSLAGSVAGYNESTFSISPGFIFTSLPQGLVFVSGEQASIPVKVKNVGSVSGVVDVRLLAAGFIDETHTISINANEENLTTFYFLLPGDIWDKNYIANAYLDNQQETPIPFYLTGYKVNVETSLDKQYYSESDTATLTMQVYNLTSSTVTLTASVSFNDYTAAQVFVSTPYLSLSNNGGSTWNYRKKMTINYSSGTVEFNNYQLQITTDTKCLVDEGKLQQDCRDIRFTDSDGKSELSYWIEEGTNTASTKIWVKIPKIYAGQTKDIYMYYDNPDAGNSGNPDNVFDYYVAFSSLQVISASLDEDKTTAQFLVSDSGREISLWGNNWKNIPKEINIAGDGSQLLEFKMKSTGTIEIAGIGFTNTVGIGIAEDFYMFFGMQEWGNAPEQKYTSINNWQTVSAALNDFSGSYSYLIFANDADASSNGDVRYRDVRLRKNSAVVPSVTISSEEAKDYQPQTLIFDNVPVNFTGKKLFYGIYTNTNWAIYLNSMYVYERGAELSLSANKQVYNAGDTVYFTATPLSSGTLIINAKDYSNSFVITSTESPVNFDFKLSTDSISGGYSVYYSFISSATEQVAENYYKFDVLGYKIDITEAKLNKSLYQTGDEFKLSLKVYSNKQIPEVTIKGTLKYNGQSQECFEMNNITLNSGTNTFDLNGYMNVNQECIPTLNCGIWKKKDSETLGLFLTGCYNLFDTAIKPAAITDLSAIQSGNNINLSWTAPGDDGTSGQIIGGLWRIAYSTASDYIFQITDYKLEISTTILPLTACRYTLSGLTAGTTYYFRMWTADEMQNWSEWSNLTAYKTWSLIESTDSLVSVYYQTATLLGETTAAYIVIEPTTSPKGMIAFSSATEAGNYVISQFYNIQPESVIFSPYGILTFNYTEPLPEYVKENDMNVYRWDDQAGWESLSVFEIMRSTSENWIKIQITSSAMYAVLCPVVVYPGTITDLSADTGINAGEINLSWTAPGNDGFDNPLISGCSYYIQYSSFSGVVWSTATAQIKISTGSPAQVNPGDWQESTVKGLDYGVTYYFMIWTVDQSNNWSDVSNEASAWTKFDITPPTIEDNQAGDEIIRNVEGMTYNVNFYDSETGIDTIQYKVCSSTGQEGDTVIDWTNIAVLGGTTYYETDWQVDFESLLSLPATNYVSVMAWDVAGNTVTFNDVFYILKDTIAPTIPILASPANSLATNYYLLTFDWEDSTDTEAGVADYELQLSTSNDFSLINQTTVTTVSQTSLTTTEGQYWWKVRAKDNAGNYSDWTSTWTVTVDTTAPESAGFESLTVESSNVIVTTGTAVDSLSGLNSVPYYIQQSTDGIIWGNYNSDWIVSSYTWAGLTPNTTYWLRAKARDNAFNESAYSDISSVVTFANPPTNSFIVGRTSFSVQFQWNANGNPAYTRWGILRSTDNFLSANELTNFSSNYTNTSYLDCVEINPATTYYYKVNAYNEDAIATAFDVGISTLTLPIPIETTPPTIVDNQTGDDTIRNASGASYNVDFYDSESGISTIQYKVTTEISQGGTILIDWTNIAVLDGTTYYETDWQVDFESLMSLPATNYVSVRVWDIVGNTVTVNDVFYILKDTISPSIPLLISPANSLATNYYLLTFDWEDSTDTEAGVADYELQLSTSNDFSLINQTTVTTVSQASLTTTEGQYWWKVRAKDNAENYSLWSSTWAVTLDTGAPVAVAFESLFVNSTDVIITTGTATDELAGLHNLPFYIQLSTDDITWGNYDSGWIISSYAWSGLTPNTTYWFRLKARDLALNESAFSGILSAISFANPPVNSFIVDKTSFSVQIQWSGNSNPAYTRWGILQSTDGFVTNSVEITNFDSNYTNTSYVIADLSANTTNWFKVKAFNEEGIATDFDTVISTLTLAAPTPSDTTAPGTITDLLVSTSIVSGSVILSWTAPGNDGTTGTISSGTYKIQYSTWADIAWSTGSASITISTDNVNPNDLQIYEITGLSEGSTYYFRMWTSDAADNWSEISNGATCYIEEVIVGTVEFICSIKQTAGAGVSFTSLKSWNETVACDLTAAGTKVFSFDSITGTALVGQAVTGQTSGATGTCVSTSATQVLIKNISGTFQSGEYVQKTGDASQKMHLINAGNSAIAVAKIDGAWTSKDTVAIYSYIYLNNWTTSETNYVKIYTTAEARHSGAWDTNKYILSGSESYIGPIRWGPWGEGAHVKIDGLQIESTAASEPCGIRDDFNSATVGKLCVHEISNCIFKWTGGTEADNWNDCAIMVQIASGTVKAWNNISIDFPNFIQSYYNQTKSTFCVYNNTVVYPTQTAGSFAGIYITDGLSGNGVNLYMKNNIVQGRGAGSCYILDNVNTSNCEKNIANDATAPGTEFDSKTVSFVSGADKYFQLSSTDTVAKDQGADLSGDTRLAFTYDINGDTRPAGSAWDIGADEMADFTAPSAVTDLSVSLTGEYINKVNLRWTATGDNGNSGTIVYGQYAIEYSTNTGEAWNTGNAQVVFSTKDVIPGSTQQYALTIPSLMGNTSYYFRIWTADCVINWSAVSVGATQYFSAGVSTGPVEFVCTIRQAGTSGSRDYSTLASWEDAIDNNLTLSTIKVFSISSYSNPTIQDNSAVTQVGTGATGTVVHVSTTNSQILIKSISGMFNTANQVQQNGATSRYVIVSNDGASPIATAKIEGSWTTADGPTTIAGWTTSEQNYVRIYTTPESRHSGVWDTNKYRISVNTDWQFCIRLDGTDHVKIDGLQLENTVASPSQVIQAVRDMSPGASQTYLREISNCIIRYTGGTPPAAWSHSAILPADVTYSGKFKIWNNIITGWCDSIQLYGMTSGSTFYIYNNTISGNSSVSGYGIYCNSNSGKSVSLHLKNNIIKRNTAGSICYSLAYIMTGVYDSNISNDATSPNSSYRSLVPIFTSTSSFHLVNADTSAVNAGIDLSGDADLAFTTDIDGESRPAGSAWDIGADEMIPDTIAPGAITRLTALPGSSSDKITLTWIAPGNDSYSRDLGAGSSFYIQISTWTNWADIVWSTGGTNVTTISTGSPTAVIQGSTQTYQVGIILAGATHYFRIWTADEAGNISDKSIEGATFYVPVILAPGAITRLTALPGSSSSKVTLQWIAPGNDNYTGNLTSSTFYIQASTWTNWQSIVWSTGGMNVTIISTGSPTAVIQGSTQTYQVGIILAGATHYFRIWTADEAGNISDKSIEGATFYAGSVDSGLAGYWKSDEGTGSNAYDYSGYSQTGSITAATWATGKIGGALSYNGSSAYTSIANTNAALRFTGNGTISAWVKLDSAFSDGGYVFMKQSDGGGYWEWGMNLTVGSTLYAHVAVVHTDGGAHQHDAYAATAITKGEWYHITGVWDTPNIKIYINGSLDTTYNAGAGTLRTGTHNPSTIGIGNSGGYFKGLIDDVRVYNRALTADEITSIYNLSVLPAAEFVSEIKAINVSGGDFKSLASWESAINCDLTASTVFSISDKSDPAIADGQKVFGETSNSTGTVVHVSTTSMQVLMNTIAGTFLSGEKIHQDGSGGYAKWVRISNTGDSPIAVAKIDGAWTGADSTAVALDGWATTSATNYIRIYTTPEARHSGVWDSSSKYRLAASVNNNGVLKISSVNVQIDGLQIENTLDASVAGNNTKGIRITGAPSQGSTTYCYISNCLIRYTGSSPNGEDDAGIQMAKQDNTCRTIKIWNNIIIGYGDGIWGTEPANPPITAVIYNNTVKAYANGAAYSVGYCITAVTGHVNDWKVYLKNNISYFSSILANQYSYSIQTYGSESYTTYVYSNNVSGDAYSPDTAYRFQTPSFLSPSTGDFHLLSTDTTGYDRGTSLSSDAQLSFSTDINGDARPFGGVWDIGADEFTDFVAPSAITNLSANTGDAAAEIDLTWTAPGDDGTTGSIYNGKFRIQYSSYTDIQWGIQNAQVVISTTCTPLSIQMYTVTGFTVETTYYFRIWTADGADNYSELSNGATAWADCAGGMGMFVVIIRADPTFKLGEVYNYPNPAKGGITPTIRIECGIADKVELKIYNMAGELVHSKQLTDSDLRILNNKYAYEYPWDIKDVASGVYVYYIHAEHRGDNPIKVLKKLAVIK